MNTPLAVSLIHEHLRDLNKFIDNYGKSAIIEKSLNAINGRLVNILGINLKRENVINVVEVISEVVKGLKNCVEVSIESQMILFIGECL